MKLQLTKPNAIKKLRTDFGLTVDEAQDIINESYAYSAAYMKPHAKQIIQDTYEYLDFVCKNCMRMIEEDNNANAASVLVKASVLMKEMFAPEEVKEKFQKLANSNFALVGTDGKIVEIDFNKAK